MFGKKRCTRCTRKIEKGFDFCPYCGNRMKNQKDYGLLGRDDENFESLEELNGFGRMPGFGAGFGSGLFDKMFSSAFKMLEKEMRNLNEEENPNKRIRQNPTMPNLPRSNFQLFINGKKIPLPQEFSQGLSQAMNSSVNNPLEDNQEEREKRRVIRKIPKISEETLRKAAGLPRKEAKTRLSRSKDKVIYELETPGLKKMENIIINKLENSFEIKVFTEKTVYFKNLPVKLPLLGYGIQGENLILEFKAS
jgi:hypothetical protein